MNDVKPWYASLGFWSALCTVLFSLAATAGIAIKVPPEDAAQAVVTIVPVILAVVSGIAAAIGRGRATKALAFSPRTLRVARMQAAACQPARPTSEMAERIQRGLGP